LARVRVYPRSVVEIGPGLIFLADDEGHKRLGLLSTDGIPGFGGQSQEGRLGDQTWVLQLCALDPDNAVTLRAVLPWTAPVCLGLSASFGLGDRLGLATPGHARAVANHDMRPVLAQQSVRELTRTGRSPQEVLDAASWGVLQEGFRAGFGADADQLSTTADLDCFIEAGFTFFTIDPSQHVADTAAHGDLEGRFEALDWESLDSSVKRCEDLYLGQSFDLGKFSLRFGRFELVHAAVKYANAVAHVAGLVRHLTASLGAGSFEVEMSVDETSLHTSALEHLFIAKELRRLGVSLVSLAPRFLGRFEKAVEYQGDLSAFEAELSRHAAIAEVCGPYKLSLHSGSNKFSIYPAMAHHTNGRVHIKTAGTSYLEALRVCSRRQPELFRSILDLARECYPADRAGYHVSAQLSRVEPSGDLEDDQLPNLLDQDDTRQVLHVTYGSVLDEHRVDLMAMLQGNDEAYAAALSEHLGRHMEPFGL
jgi:hypothetical protein